MKLCDTVFAPHQSPTATTGAGGPPSRTMAWAADRPTSTRSRSEYLQTCEAAIGASMRLWRLLRRACCLQRCRDGGVVAELAESYHANVDLVGIRALCGLFVGAHPRGRAPGCAKTGYLAGTGQRLEVVHFLTARRSAEGGTPEEEVPFGDLTVRVFGLVRPRGPRDEGHHERAPELDCCRAVSRRCHGNA